ncbi:Organic cation transporter-like protein [Portunus trituberculatus]|uniref:Organic cation transporter-like protein n=1 Tax=Portunus trituberculatus TaxID=210409 RepID=A0A5B7IWL8_PORTR|nr:Organic cation transporter-like protein [Portunus trituberculatus]
MFIGHFKTSIHLHLSDIIPSCSHPVTLHPILPPPPTATPSLYTPSFHLHLPPILPPPPYNHSSPSFRTPRLRMITVCVFLGYTMASMVYFGLSLSGGTISDNPYVFMTLSGLMEVPAYTFTIPVVQRFGRKYTLATCFLLSALVLFALAVIPAGYSVAGVALAMMGKVCITAGFQTIIFFSSELFPTEVRSRGVSAAFMMSRIGSMVSPFITDLVVSGLVLPLGLW